MSEFRTRRRIEFSDTDAGGQVHFSRFFAFMETAEDEFLRSLGASFDMPGDDGRRLGWPKVAVSCEYRSPIRYGDEVGIVLRVVRRGSRSVTYEFHFGLDDRQVAVGRTTSVCCRERAGGGYESVPIPTDLARRIGEAAE